MKERINWIDWVKAFCMTVVVFCHLPQQEDTFYLQYLASVILSSFFFISGYLKKTKLSPKESFRKYGHSLLIPYIIYNLLYYPYWLIKFHIEHGGNITVKDCGMPIIGTLLGQLNSSFSCELNGVTWFLIALFMMHWITDVCNRHKNGKVIMVTISIICVFLYGANKHYHYAPYLTYHGLIRCICFFFMGNIFQQAGYLRGDHPMKDLRIGGTALFLSLILFYWHINEHHFMLHILLYYIVNALSVYAIIYLCRSINHFRLHVITITSVGTMLIFGLHRIFIGVIDFGIEALTHTNNIIFNWYEGIALALLIELVLIPCILLSLKHFPILLGRNKSHGICKI